MDRQIYTAATMQSIQISKQMHTSVHKCKIARGPGNCFGNSESSWWWNFSKNVGNWEGFKKFNEFEEKFNETVKKIQQIIKFLIFETLESLLLNENIIAFVNFCRLKYQSLGHLEMFTADALCLWSMLCAYPGAATNYVSLQCDNRSKSTIGGVFDFEWHSSPAMLTHTHTHANLTAHCAKHWMHLHSIGSSSKPRRRNCVILVNLAWQIALHYSKWHCWPNYRYTHAIHCPPIHVLEILSSLKCRNTHTHRMKTVCYGSSAECNFLNKRNFESFYLARYIESFYYCCDCIPFRFPNATHCNYNRIDNASMYVIGKTHNTRKPSARATLNDRCGSTSAQLSRRRANRKHASDIEYATYNIVFGERRAIETIGCS